MTIVKLVLRGDDTLADALQAHADALVEKLGDCESIKVGQAYFADPGKSGCVEVEVCCTGVRSASAEWGDADVHCLFEKARLSFPKTALSFYYTYHGEEEDV